jgi:hypothetical protein
MSHLGNFVSDGIYAMTEGHRSIVLRSIHPDERKRNFLKLKHDALEAALRVCVVREIMDPQDQNEILSQQENSAESIKTPPKEIGLGEDFDGGQPKEATGNLTESSPPSQFSQRRFSTSNTEGSDPEDMSNLRPLAAGQGTSSPPVSQRSPLGSSMSSGYPTPPPAINFSANVRGDAAPSEPPRPSSSLGPEAESGLRRTPVATRTPSPQPPPGTSWNFETKLTLRTLPMGTRSPSPQPPSWNLKSSGT